MDSNSSHTTDLHWINDASLKAYNTFGIDHTAHQLIRLHSEEQIVKVLSELESDPLILGGGSNILLLGDIARPVLKQEIKGKEIVYQDAEEALVSFGAGENWHECVLWSLDNELYGLENLSLIPGTVGAAPMQNIGAYGVELCDVFHSLVAIEKSSGIRTIFHSEDCQFGYRDSFFKQEGKGKYIISRVFLKLSIKPNINKSYASLAKLLEERNISHPTPRQISDAVIEIRSSKLPDVHKIGNSGSFFKNPIIPIGKFEELKRKHPNIVSYPVDGNHVKLAAGWLIDQCGWKGYREGDAACYEKQALVLVNYGNATGQDIWRLAQKIQTSVLEEFEVQLEPEVNLIGMG